MPEVYLVPRDVISEAVWVAMHEDRGGAPNWCTIDDDHYQHFELTKLGLAVEGEIPKGPPIVVTHSFSYVVG
jgi:hypothetical protein